MLLFQEIHVHILIVILTISGLGFINLSRYILIKKITTLIMWSGLIIASVMAFTNYESSVSDLILNNKTGILFAYSALLMIPALLNYPIFIGHRGFHDILFIPLLLFFLTGFNNPFIWFFAFEGICIITGTAFNLYSVSSYRMKHIFSAVIFLTGLILLSTTSSHDIANVFIFFSLMLKYDFPENTACSSKNISYYLYFSVIRASATLFLMIKIFPVIQPMQYKIASVILLFIGITSALIRFSRNQEPFSFLALAVNSMYLPYMLLASSGLSHLFGFYVFLYIPLLLPFIFQKWAPGDGKIPKGYFLTLLTVQGFPITAGMVVWIRFIRHILDFPVYNSFAYAGFIYLFSFWIFILKKIVFNAEMSFNSENKQFNGYLLTIIIYNGMFWLFYIPVMKFFIF